MGCYPVCASRMSFNQEPESVVCNFVIDPECNIDLKGNFILFFSNGKTAFGSYSYDNFYQSTYSIWGKTSLIELPRAYAIKPHVNSRILIHTDDGIDDIEIPWVDQSQEMIDEFCQVIKNEINSSFDYEMDFLLQAKVLEALRLSSKEKRLVKLNELN